MGVFLFLLMGLTLLITLIFLVIFLIRVIKKQKNKRQAGMIALVSFGISIVLPFIGSQLFPFEEKETQLNQDSTENINASLENRTTLIIKTTPVFELSPGDWKAPAGTIARTTSNKSIGSSSIKFEIVDENDNKIEMPHDVNSWFENVPSIDLTIPAGTIIIPYIEKIVFNFVIDGTDYSMDVGVGSRFIVSKLDNGKYKLHHQ